MTSHSIEEAAPKEKGGIPVIYGLIFVIMVIACYTTIHGLYSLTGQWIYAIPFGFVAQAIMLIASLNLGKDIAELAGHRTTRAKLNARARAFRSVFLIGVYALFFSICWFFAFTTYYNLFLSRGDDVETTVNNTNKLADIVIPKLYDELNTQANKEISSLKNNPAKNDFVQQLDILKAAAGKEAYAAAIRSDVATSLKAIFTQRQTDRANWMTEKGKLVDRQSTLKGEIAALEKRVEELRKEDKDLPARRAVLEQAIREEVDGPPIVEAGGAQKPNSADKRRLQADGLASKLVPDAKPCKVARGVGRGDAGADTCIFALEASLRLAKDKRPSELRKEIQKNQTDIDEKKAEDEAIPKRLTQLDAQLVAYPALAPPVGTDQALPFDSRPLETAVGGFKDAVDKMTSLEAVPQIKISFAALGDACQPVVAALGKPGVRNKLPEETQKEAEAISHMSCKPSALTAAVDRLQGLADARALFYATCGSAAGNKDINKLVGIMRDEFGSNPDLRSDDKKRRDRLGQLIEGVRRDIIERCLASAGELGVSSKVREDLNQAARGHEEKVSLRQTEFSLAINASQLVVQGNATPPAYLGALFAAAQELGILLLTTLRDISRAALSGGRTGLGPVSLVNWSPDPSDPPPVAAAKAILSVPNESSGSLIVSRTFLDEVDPGVRADVAQILRQMRREGLAKASLIGKSLKLSPEAVEHLERQIEAYYSGKTASPPGKTPDPEGRAGSDEQTSSASKGPPLPEGVEPGTVPFHRQAIDPESVPPAHGSSHGGKLERKWGVQG